ncbi:ATP-binding protein [Streptomyces kasugaensis]|nr:ATP-binding protein [Streptomyces kasugaensis]
MSARARSATTRLTPAPPLTAAYHLPADARSARRARDGLREQLRIWGIDGELADVAELLASELVANAVTATLRTDRTDIGFRADLSAGRLRLEVDDASDQLPLITQAEEDEECGRGLLLVNALASSWGVIVRGATEKTVWAELTLPDAPDT